MEAKAALKVLRNRALDGLGDEFSQQSRLFMYESYRSIPKHQYTLNNPATWVYRIQSMSPVAILPPSLISSQLESSVELNSVELKERADLVISYLARGAKSKTEEQICDINIQLILSSLLSRCLDATHQSRSLEQVRSLLLEMAVSSSVEGRKLAFTLLFNLSIQTQVYWRKIQHYRDESTSVQSTLFGLLVEMLEKLVVVDRLKASSAWENAIGCLFYFVTSRETICADRLIQIDPHILLALIEGVPQDVDPNTEFRLFEILIYSIYTRTVNDQVKRGTVMPALGNPYSSVAFRKFRGTCSNMPFQLQYPLDHENQPKFQIHPENLKHYGGLEFFVHRYHTTHSLRLQRLLFMVLFDVATYDENENNSNRSEILEIFNSNDFAFVVHACPSVLFKDSIPRVAEKLQDELVSILSDLATILRVEEYYVESQSLKSAANILLQQQKPQDSGPEAIIEKISNLIGSENTKERTKAEIWLAELLTHGATDSPSFLKQNTTMGDELEETVVFDEVEEIRSLARGKFWALGKSKREQDRLAFVHVLTLFVRRRNQPNDTSAQLRLMNELNTCLLMIVEANETCIGILTNLMLLILEISVRPYSYFHRVWLKKNNGDRSIKFHQPTALHATDSIAALVLNGDAALDSNLLSRISPKFFVHVLYTLSCRVHPAKTCTGSCCGINEKIPGDVLSCCAFILQQMCQQNHQIFTDTGGLDFYTQFLDACDTRVAMFIARVLLDHIRQTSKEQYHASLCDILVSSQADGDERQLDNPYLQCRTILNNYWRPTTV